MGNKYYYLVASLPYLQLNEAPAISVEKFIFECEKWLTAGDMEQMLSADIRCSSGKCPGSGPLRKWKEFDDQIREELVLIREAKKRNEEYRGVRLLEEVMREDNALLMENALERIRWEYLEEEKSKHFFDINWLVLYYLELQILVRMGTFNKDKGESNFYELCEVNYEGAIR